jgi:CheY-like chemotaxis protein
VIHEARDDQQALAVLATQPLDLIVMNLGLPVLDGGETTRRIRTLPPPSGQVIIAFMAYAWGTEEQRALAAGWNASLVQPILAPQGLEQTVVGLLTSPQRPEPADSARGSDQHGRTRLGRPCTMEEHHTITRDWAAYPLPSPPILRARQQQYSL